MLCSLSKISDHCCLVLWMCGFSLKDSKKNMEVRELLGLEPVSLFTKRSRLWWLGHVEYKDESHWVKRCMLM